MSSIPPKPRITNRQEYYTKGEAEKIIPARFKAHSAEPGQAASIMSRNSNTFEKPSHKIPTTIRTGIYSGRPSETSFSQALSLTEVNLLKSKEFAK